jgi:hypothetical protein
MQMFKHENVKNLQEQVKKESCYQKLFWPFTIRINCSSDLKKFENSRPSASNFKSFSWSLEHFFLTVDQNNFGNKIPFSFSGHSFIGLLTPEDVVNRFDIKISFRSFTENGIIFYAQGSKDNDFISLTILNGFFTSKIISELDKSIQNCQWYEIIIFWALSIKNYAIFSEGSKTDFDIEAINHILWC